MILKKYYWFTIAIVFAVGYVILTFGTHFSNQKVVLGGTVSGVDGAGIVTDPYLLDSCDDISNLANDYNDGSVSTTFHARVTQDIDCSGVSNLLPIATSTGNGFQGVFDGGGFTISEITMDYADDDYTTGLTNDTDGAENIGLFGVVSGGTVKNVILEDAFVKGYQYVGGIAGQMVSGTIWRSQVNVSSVSVDSVTSTCSSGDGCIWARYGEYGGGIVGEMTTGTLRYVVVGGSVRGSGEYIGGIVGKMDNGLVNEAASSAWIDAGAIAGGIVGSMVDGLIEKSYATGDVTVFEELGVSKPGRIAGGFAGNVSTGTIRNSYSTGDVQGANSSLGGFVGSMTGVGGTLQNVYSTGSVTSLSTTTPASIGGILGIMNIGLTAENIFTVSPIITGTTTAYSGAFMGLTTDVTLLDLSNIVYVSSSVGIDYCLYDSNTATSSNPAACSIDTENSRLYDSANEPLASWDFVNDIWLESEASFPTLVATSFYDGGYGTPENPYLITTCVQLQNMSDDLDASYEVTEDIDCSGSSAWNGGSGFDPIGTSSTLFTGIFDGGGYTITALYIDRANDDTGEDPEDEDDVGLFGATEGATITDVHLREAFVKGFRNVGGIIGSMGTSTVLTTSSVNLTTSIEGNRDCSDSECVWARYGFNGGGAVGKMYGGTLRNVQTSGPVKGSGSYIGGMVGYMASGTVLYASTTAYVDGGEYIGGFVGRLDNGSIDQSYAAGEVVLQEEVGLKAARYAGGFVGFAQNGTITNAYTTASVTGPDPAGFPMYYGGFVGVADSSSTISQAYATGDVSVSGTQYVAGFVGAIEADATLTDAFTVSAIAATNSESIAGFGAATIVLGLDNADDLYFDVSSTGYSYCFINNSVTTSTPDACTAINSDGSQPDYFYDATNDVFVNWDFENIWQERLEDHPILAMGGSITAVDRTEEEVEEEEEEVSSGGGGGGGGFVAPSKPTLEAGTSATDGALLINNGANETNSSAVTLTINATRVAQVAISEDSTFAGESLVDYSGGDIAYELTPEYGEKVVYVKLRSSAGGTLIVQDSITLVAASTRVLDNELSVPITTSACALSKGSSYKTIDSPTVYYISEDCRRYGFANPAQFFSYFNSFTEVQVVDMSALDRVDLTSEPVPWGPRTHPQPIGFLRSLEGPDRNIYVSLYGKKHKIASVTLFEDIGYDISWITPASQALIQGLTTGIEHTRTDIHPDYTLITYTNSPHVYRLESNSDGRHVRRLIIHEEAFNRHGFRWDRIVEVNPTTYYTFPDGPNIE